MTTKAELLGCEYETGMCEHYIPGDGKVINGVMRYPGIGNVPMGHGRCMKDDKMISRILACPISGKSSKKQTKAEQFGCAACEYLYKKSTVPCCELAGQYAAINALHECPKTMQTEPPTEEELIQRYGCPTCVRFKTFRHGTYCQKSHLSILDVSECPGKETQQPPDEEKSAVPEGKERWDYRTLPGDVQAVDYWYDVGRKTVFETTCGTLGECRKARDQFFEAQAQKAPPPTPQTEEDRLGCTGEACKKYEKSNIPNVSATCNGKPGWSMGLRCLEKCPGPYPVEQSAPTQATPPMKIMAFDVSTTITGWALREGDKITERGTIRAPKGGVEERKDYIRQQILHYCLNGQPLNVVMLERSFVAGSGNTTRLLCELQGIIKSYCYRMGYPVIEPSPTTWRAICPGSGKCDKDAAVEYARLKNYTFESIDEAEAICMALSFSTELVKILDAEKEKKKNGKSKSKEGSNGNHGSNGGKRRGVAAGIAVSACATKAS